jgi:hypothetical protein
MHRYKMPSYTAPVAILLILITFASMSMSWFLHQYPNQVYGSNISCNRITDLRTCEKEQNGLRSSDGSGDLVIEDEVDDTSLLRIVKIMKFRL